MNKKLNSLISRYKETESFSLFSGTSLGNLIEIASLEEFIINTLNDVDKIQTATFCNGLSGLGWFLQYLINQNLFEKESVEELLTQIDEISYKSALNFIKNNNHDFLHGAVGNSIYLINRVEENKAVVDYLSIILKELDRISCKTKDGTYWNQCDFMLLKDEKSKDIINLGLAHGLASKIVLLTKLNNRNINNPLSKELLLESVKFLLNNKNAYDSVSVFPTNISKKKKNNYSRLSWCHGDLGISIALWQAGEALQDESIKREAINICLHTTKRKTREETGVVDLDCSISAGSMDGGGYTSSGSSTYNSNL